MKLALIIDEEDRSFLPHVKKYFDGHQVAVITKCPETTFEVAIKVDGIICAQEEFLKLVIKRRGSIDDYAGSLYHQFGKPVVIVDPIKQIITVPHGGFIFKRYIDKIIRPEIWQSEIPFEWEELKTQERFDELYSLASGPNCIAISIDVETGKDPLRIKICSYSIIHTTTVGSVGLVNFTFPISMQYQYEWMRLLNSTPCPKVMQNGIYDSSWFIYYGCPPTNYLLDTQDLFHCWYAELPKSLAFVSAFCVRDMHYWKKDADTGVREDFLRYGCMDVWGTSCSLLYLLQELPVWAWKNYLIKFPLNFPSLLCGYRGWKIDEIKRAEVKEEQIPDIEENKKLLQAITGIRGFNPNSPPQVKAVLNILSTKGKVDSSDKKTLEKVSTQHAINQFICNAILEYRKAFKLVRSYIDATLINGRFLYTLAPSGTDTLRMASHGSVFWTGNSIQTIPRGNVIKSFYVADDGYFLGEPDAEQAEARCVAYLSGDENLIATVESPLDYHRQNAEKFFGVPYDEINEEIRDLSKRTNHGANYNMGANVLLVTMGVRNVVKAQQLLNLPKDWSLKRVCQHLLDVYSATYPKVKGPFYSYLIDCVQTTHKVTSQLGWTRYFFGQPWKDGHKTDVNALVAHVPQNLNVGIINESFLKLYDLEKRSNGNFKLLAQIHDSIPFQYKIGRLDLACEAARIMERSIPVTDWSGKTREMLIPIKLKAEGRYWSELSVIKNFREL